MMWDRVIEACITLLQNDSELVSILGGAHIYRNRSATSIQTPGVFYTIVSNTLEENYAPVVLQWDLFGQDLDTVSRIENRLFQLMHSDLPVVMNGLTMWSQFQDGYDFTEEDETIMHRAVEYKYTPARENG